MLELSWISGIGGFVVLGVTERGVPVTTYAAYPFARRRVYVDTNGDTIHPQGLGVFNVASLHAGHDGPHFKAREHDRGNAGRRRPTTRASSAKGE